MSLATDYNFKGIYTGDELYQQLLDAHQNLSTEESHAFNIRLLLILINHVGDKETLTQAIKAAREG